MKSRARVDKRGRIQIPRSEREAAGIPVNSEVAVLPKGKGRLELILVSEKRLEDVHRIAKGRLKNWSEENHSADELLERLVSEKNT